MEQQIQTALSTVDLTSLATQLSKDFNLKLTMVTNSQQEKEQADIDLVLEHKPNLECLTIARNYSEDLFDYEQFSVYHSLGDNEQTHIHYHSSKPDYFKSIFHEIKNKENEFISSLKADYEEILREWSKKSKGGIYYIKRISNDQRTLEELFNYAAFKFKGLKFST